MLSCNRQPNIRDVGYAHLAVALHVDGVDPFHEKERFEEVCRYLDMMPGEKPIPEIKEKLRLYFTLYPTPWCSLFSNVPRDISNPTENLDTVAKFMHKLHKGEEKSGKRVDGKPTK